MDITRWSTLKSDWLYSLHPKMEKLYTVSQNKTGSWLWLRSWTPYCQIHTEIEESRKTTRPLRHDLNQIPYDYTVESEVAQLYLTLWDPMDCSLSGSSVHGIFQARLLEWIAISFSKGSSRPKDRTRVSCITGRCFTIWATREAPSLY